MIIVAVLFILLTVTPVYATIINVPSDQPSIQQGINASTDGDTVLVHPGTYYENVNFNGHNIVLGSLFLTTSDTSYISTTIIDGDSAGSVITYENAEDSTTILTGFTIQNGFSLYGGGIHCSNSAPQIIANIIIQNYSNGFGGGIYCSNSDLTISENQIINNQATNDNGGGIYCFDSAVIITDNTVAGNLSGCYGGGIYFLFSNLIISNNTISENTAGARGGGMLCFYSEAVISYNVIKNNSANYRGGAICCFQANPVLNHNLIIGNSCVDWGGGIYFASSDPVLLNNTFSGNRSSSGGAIYFWGSNPEVTNTIFWADSANTGQEIYANTLSSPVITYCDIEGGWLGEGNIDLNPLFVDPSNDNFHLQIGSPCIDAGDPNSLPDPDNTRADIGAFYFDQSTDITSKYLIPADFHLRQNYPNPFNCLTTIQYEIPIACHVTIDIYDLLGCKIETLIKQHHEPGFYQLSWNGKSYSSGVYFCKFRTKAYTQAKKMLLLR